YARIFGKFEEVRRPKGLGLVVAIALAAGSIALSNGLGHFSDWLFDKVGGAGIFIGLLAAGFAIYFFIREHTHGDSGAILEAQQIRFITGLRDMESGRFAFGEETVLPLSQLKSVAIKNFVLYTEAVFDFGERVFLFRRDPLGRRQTTPP